MIILAWVDLILWGILNRKKKGRDANENQVQNTALVECDIHRSSEKLVLGELPEEKTEVLKNQEKDTGRWMLVHTTQRIRGRMLWCCMISILAMGCSASSVLADTEIVPELKLEWKTEPYRMIDDVAYFNQDPVIAVYAREQITGLASLEVRSQNQILYENWEISRNQLTGELQGELQIPSRTEGRRSVIASAISVADRKTTVELSCVVDQTAPIIELNYQTPVPGMGETYSDIVEAELLIRDPCFDPNGVQIQIQGEHGSGALLSGWTSSGPDLHSCNILFEQDDTYRFSVSATDLAGNTAVLPREDRFTIDRTAPRAEFTMSPANGKTESDMGIRNCRITVTEENFDASLIRIHVLHQGQDWIPKGWSQDGIHYSQEFLLEAEGNYQILIEGSDKAGNQIRKLLADNLWIDSGSPLVQWDGVVNGQIYSSEQQVRLSVTDPNLNPESLVVFCESSRYGVLYPQIQKEYYKDGKETIWTLSGFGQLKGFSDLYHLKVLAEDLAGHVTSSELLFGVNRSGSVYTGGNQRTDELLNSEMIPEYAAMEDLVFREENLDRILERNILVMRDGSLIEQKNAVRIEEILQDDGWYLYLITIPQTIFEEEGDYTVSIVSRDASGYYSSPAREGTNLEFRIRKRTEAAAKHLESDHEDTEIKQPIKQSIKQPKVETIADCEKEGDGPALLLDLFWILLGALLLGLGILLTIRIAGSADTGE